MLKGSFASAKEKLAKIRTKDKRNLSAIFRIQAWTSKCNPWVMVRLLGLSHKTKQYSVYLSTMLLEYVFCDERVTNSK